MARIKMISATFRQNPNFQLNNWLLSQRNERFVQNTKKVIYILE
jgi:hypothetical protein